MYFNNKDDITQLFESFDKLMLTNPELYLKLVNNELKENIKLKIIDIDLKYIIRSDFVYIDISSLNVKNIINLGSLFKTEIKIGFTDEMIKPQIKINNEYREVENLDELNISELTISFNNFCENELRYENNILILQVEAILHKIVYDKIKKEEIFKYYMISIIHDRILHNLRNQINITNSERIIDKILFKCKSSKIISKYATIENIGFSKDNINIKDLEFFNNKINIKHTLSITCYKDYNDIIITNNNNENIDKNNKIIQELNNIKDKKINELPFIWKELDDLNSIIVEEKYLPIFFKAITKKNNLVLKYKFKSPNDIINNLDKINAQVSNISFKITYESTNILYLNLINFIKKYHNCSLCNPIFNYKESILMCNKNYLEIFLPIENICDIIKYNLK